MITELLRKWFGLPVPICQTCEILRDQLDESNRERKELLHRLLENGKPEPLPPPNVEELKPIQSQFVPWRVKQQILETEDRRAAQLMKDRTKEIADLEKQLGVNNASEVGQTISIHAGDSSRNEAEKGPGTVGIRS